MGVEAEWLNEWRNANGVPPDATVVVVQASNRQIADAVFGGQSQAAVSAIAELLGNGTLRLVHKGIKGHGSLYLLGVSGVTETQENATVSNNGLGHDFEKLGHDFEKYGHSSDAATCGNDALFSTKTVANSEGQGKAEEKRRCPRCGGELEPGGEYMPNLLYCRSCDVALPAKKKVA